MDELMDELPSHLFKQLICLDDLDRVPTAARIGKGQRCRALDDLMDGLDELEREEAEAERVQREVERALRNDRVDADGNRYPGGVALVGTDDVVTLQRRIMALQDIASRHLRQHDGKAESRRRGQHFADIETLEVYREQLQRLGKKELAVEETARLVNLSSRTIWRLLKRMGVTAALRE